MASAEALNLRFLALAIALAALMTLLNAIKPPVIDDPVYLSYAREFAAHPSQPYAFSYYSTSANDILVPPVLPAWLAVGNNLLGGDPFLLKLWLFPIVLLLVVSLRALLRRFATGLEVPLLVLTALSPAVLPSINLMLDIPALAFGLAAAAVFFRAADRKSTGLAILAGALAGLAMETKYTAFTLPAVFVCWGYFNRCWKPAILASATAILLFGCCEALIALTHGDSHFVLAMLTRGRRHNPFLVFRLITALFALFGGLTPMLWLLGASALGFSGRLIGALCLAFLGGLVLLAVVPDEHTTLLQISGCRPLLNLNHVVFIPVGAAFMATVTLISRHLLRAPATANSRDRAVNCFLVGWLVIEAAGYLAISPFPAVRRILGLLIVSTFVIGRFAARYSDAGKMSRHSTRLALAGAVLGLGFYAIELRDALAEEEAFHGAVTFVRGQDSSAPIRCYGTWGVVYHAEKEGLLWSPEVGEDLQPGDWFIHDPRDGRRIAPPIAGKLVEVARITIRHGPALCTQRTFYESRTPILHSDGPHAEVIIYRYPLESD
jgi:hypothetical protein